MNMRKRCLAGLLALALCASALSAGGTALATGASDTALVKLETSNQVNPLGMDETPEFGWNIESMRIGAAQTAYQIRVYQDKLGGELVWDSGRQESAVAANIRYGSTGEAQPLEAGTRYYWTVTVWDEEGNEVTSSGGEYFETGLMSTSLDAWGGAQWIGASTVPLNADSMYLFDMSCSMELADGSSQAGFVFGANDPRLNSAVYNNYLVEGENYIYYQVDITGLQDDDPETTAVYNILRKGYCTADYEQPDSTSLLATVEIPDSLLNEDNMYDAHDYLLKVDSCQASLAIDGTAVGNKLTLNPTGATTDTPMYPRMNDVGFAAGEGDTAEITDFTIRHGKTTDTVLLSEDVNATYSIFAGKEGVTVSGNAITVEDTMAYADPTYGSTPMLRTEVQAEKEVANARLYVTSRGIYEMYINGQRVGDEYFNPGQRQYEGSIAYNTYDVTDMIAKGENAVGAMLSSGWWNDQMSFSPSNYNKYGDNQALLAKLVIEYADGTGKTVVTDPSQWKTYSDGPIVYSGLFDGEEYDATKEAAVEGWSSASYDDSSWDQAVVVGTADEEKYGNAEIVSAIGQQVKLYETLDASYVGEQTRGNTTVYIYDMGANMIGVPQIKLPEMAAGTKVTIRYAEFMYPDLAEDNPYNYGDLTGMILTENYRNARSIDTYVAKGTPGGETYTPTFTFHGYQYIEISGISAPLPEENIKGRVYSSIGEITSQYDSSNGLTNQLYSNIVRSTLGNHLSIPTDCNQRNERMGWTGDAMVFSETATYFADVDQFYSNWLRIGRDSQDLTTNDIYPNTWPAFGSAWSSSVNGSGMAWPAAGIVVPYQTYRQYGDTGVIEEHLESMRRCLESMAKDVAPGHTYLLKTGGLAEHLAVVDTDSTYCSNIIFIYLERIFAEMAQAVGETELAQTWSDRAQATMEEFNQVFINPETSKPQTLAGAVLNTEAAYDLAIAYGVVADNYLEAFADNLAAVCAEGHDGTPYTITTGFIGTAPLLPALTQTGKVDEAYKMFEQTEYASWLYPVTQGATSIWERWNSYTVENGFGGNNGMNSFNHYALGAVGAWMMGYQVGIQRSEETAGYQNFVLQPTPGGSFTYVNGSYASNYGKIVSNWTADGQGGLTSYEAVVPANTSATLYLPVSSEAVSSFKNIDGVTFTGMTEHNGQTCAEFALQAGGYSFAVADGALSVSHQDGYTAENTANKSILRKVLSYAEAQFASDEFDSAIADVQASFTAALENARAVDADLSAEQAEVDFAWQTLMTEIHKLGFVRGDKTSLGQLIETAEEFYGQIGLYTPATSGVFVSALQEAKVVFDDGNAMQQDVETAESELLEAMMNLRFKADKSILEEVLGKAAQIDLTKYTAQSVGAFNAANEAAQAVNGDPEATQQQVNAAADSLNAAVKALEAIDGSQTDERKVRGDRTVTTGSGNAKTGETAPIAVAVAMVALAAAGIAVSRKKK